jgi:type II secretory pathway pseudopilin PulG
VTLQKQSGFSLLAALVGLAILGIGATLMSRHLSFGMRATQRIKTDVDMQLLKTFIIEGTSCRMSIEALCTPGSLLSLNRDLGGIAKVIVSGDEASPTYFGDSAVRALCAPTGQGIQVQYGLLKKGRSLRSNNASDFKPDPLTSKIKTFNDNDLFLEGLELCASGADQPKLERTLCGLTDPTRGNVGGHGNVRNLCQQACGTPRADICQQQELAYSLRFGLQDTGIQENEYVWYEGVCCGNDGISWVGNCANWTSNRAAQWAPAVQYYKGYGQDDLLFEWNYCNVAQRIACCE